MCKILILVISVKTSERYSALMKAQKETWDSIQEDDVKTLYFYGERKGEVEEDEYCTYTGDQYHYQHIKAKKVLDLVWYWDWDFIFGTTNASYVDKKRLKEYCSKLPKEKVNCGIDEKTFTSGCGIIYSRDVIDIIRKECCQDISDDVPDVTQSQILKLKYNIGTTHNGERVDYYGWNFEILYNKDGKKISITSPYIPCCHYRCKHPTLDYNKEIEAFKNLFNFLNK